MKNNLSIDRGNCEEIVTRVTSPSETSLGSPTDNKVKEWFSILYTNGLNMSLGEGGGAVPSPFNFNKPPQTLRKSYFSFFGSIYSVPIICKQDLLILSRKS